ncbi:MAG TPA: FHA domain-containing protein [Blastocatellia bacterium]|nr:FHA domain-containing protein [Blastocatellia bacterium]
MSKFIITRKDQEIDQIVIESEGLTMGRLTGNDLVLNHPTVSRTHAGIKEVGGDYWIFNLSQANGTLINGEQVENTPLADGDLIQIGPFMLRPGYTQDGLAITVEMSINPLPIEGGATGLLQQATTEGGKTVMLSQAALEQRDKPTPKGTRRLSGTGLLTGMLPQLDQQALKIFWDKRKREAGKLSEESPLRPKTGRRLGKAQFNWRPTRDLQRPWPVGLFIWATLIVTVLSTVAVFAFKDAYSPGALSNPHARSKFDITPAIATQPNAGSCTTCHTVGKSIDQKCAECHTTSAFHSEVSAKHVKAGLNCTDCHKEHEGRGFSPAAVANVACTNCHRDGVVSNGIKLKTPHGGTLGYPLTDGQWKWEGIRPVNWQSKGLPGEAASFSLKDQFHLVHVAGQRFGRSNCSDCHTAGFEPATVKQGVRESCVTCHSVSYQAAEKKEGGAGCVSCHAQHGEEKELRAALRRIGRPQEAKAPTAAARPGQPAATGEDN